MADKAAQGSFTVASEQEPFIMIPLWILDASPQAVKLYAVLKRFANNTTNEAWPTREKLAEAAGYSSIRSLAKPLQELEQIGAVTITRSRGEDGMNTSNKYFLHVGKPGKPVGQKTAPPRSKNPGKPVGQKTAPLENQGGRKQPEGGAFLAQEGGQNSAPKLEPLTTTRTNELEPAETAVSARAEGMLPIEEAEPSNVVALRPVQTVIAKDPIAAHIDAIAKQAYEDVNKSVPFMGLRRMTTWAANQGYTPQQVQTAFRDLFQAGRAVTQQTVAQYLAGIITSTGRTAPASTTDQRVQQGMALVEQFRQLENQGAAQ